MQLLSDSFSNLARCPAHIPWRAGILFSEAALKGAHFVQLCAQRRIPLLFLQASSAAAPDQCLRVWGLLLLRLDAEQLLFCLDAGLLLLRLDAELLPCLRSLRGRYAAGCRNVRCHLSSFRRPFPQPQDAAL